METFHEYLPFQFSGDVTLISTISDGIKNGHAVNVNGLQPNNDMIEEKSTLLVEGSAPRDTAYTTDDKQIASEQTDCRKSISPSQTQITCNKNIPQFDDVTNSCADSVDEAAAQQQQIAAAQLASAPCSDDIEAEDSVEMVTSAATSSKANHNCNNDQMLSPMSGDQLPLIK